MADPVATVEKIVKLGLAIKDAVDTVRHNEEECREIRKRVLRFSAILSQLQHTGMMSDSPAMSGALEDLEETLQHALDLVTACQERSTIRRLVAAADMSKQLRRVKDDILNKVMLASFAIHTTTIVLLTVQAGGHPPPRHAEDARVVEVLHSNQSTGDARSELNDVGKNIHVGTQESYAIREFGWSELKVATDGFSDGNIIDIGGFFTVYKGVLNDGKFVAIKKIRDSSYITGEEFYDQFLLASKLQHKNIVKVLGFHREVLSTSLIQWINHKKGCAKECKFIWVEEYAPNGNLGMITHESQLDWSSLFRIIYGVAQGLRYLHDQRLVHLDVKPHNIVLDSDMNPKITDFHFAMVLDDNNEVDCIPVGTIGYMAPELIFGGTISAKADVYGFGITLLETVCIMCTSKPYDIMGDSYRSVLEWAWGAWNAGRIVEYFDPLLFDGSQLMEIERCVQVGLLCAQPYPEGRPTMADVLLMLNGKKELPTPDNVLAFGFNAEGGSDSDGSISPR